MQQAEARERMLKKIRQALETPVPVPFHPDAAKQLFARPTEDEVVLFAENFTRLQGRFAFCINRTELQQTLAALIQQKNWKKIFCSDDKVLHLLPEEMIYHHDLASCDVAITGCEYLVARTGSIALSSRQALGRTASVYAPVHICIANASQLVYDIDDAIRFLTARYEHNLPSLITFATGPSRTADIEKTLVTGVHGPGEVFCILLEDSPVL
jgi:L-lactate dehydrogenase complex protein LldG